MKKKIMIIHGSTGYGGATLSLKDTIDMLLNHYQIVLYIPENSSQMNFKLLSENDVEINTFKKHPPIFAHYSGINALITPGFWRGLISWKNKKYWYGLIKSERPDAVLVNSSVLSPMSKIIKKANAAAICFNRETHNMSCFGLLNWVMQKYLDRMDLVFFLSNSEREHFSLNNAKSITVTDILNDKLFSASIPKKVARKKLRIANQEFITLFLGGISQIKGTEIALQAMEKIMLYDIKDIKMLMLGNVEEQVIPQSLMKRYIYGLLHRSEISYFTKCKGLLGSLDNVILCGTQKDVGLYYSAADVLIFPSSKVHQARPVYEAGFYSLPVIISDFPETREFALNELNALCVIPNDPDDLAEKILTLYNNHKLMETLGSKNREMTLSLHSFVDQSRIFLSSINEVLKQ